MYKALLLIIALPLVLPAAVAPAQSDLTPEQIRFIAARYAIEAGDERLYRRLAADLSDYGLAPYLRYTELVTGEQPPPEDALETFLERHRALPVTAELRGDWLRRLGEAGRWAKLLEVYDGRNDTRIRCFVQRARLQQNGRDADWVAASLDLWLVGRSQPEACDPVFAVLYRNGDVTTQHLWQRIERSLENNKVGLARYLAQRLPADERARVADWLGAHRNPAQALNDPDLRADTPLNRRILGHALDRLIPRDPVAAHRWWVRNADKYDFSTDRALAWQRRIALHAVYQDHPAGSAWLTDLPAAAINDTVRDRHLRTLLEQRDWTGLASWLEGYPPAARDTRRWRYWRARAHQAAGEPGPARRHLEALAGTRSYYGFRAADRLERDYAFTPDELPRDPAAGDQLLLRRPALHRGLELYAVGPTGLARREWLQGIRGLGTEDLKTAATLAHQQDWHGRAITTVARASHWDDLELRFPLIHRETLHQEAKRHDLDPAWVYAIARKESAFMPDIRSPAGAIGLMQLMPATAAEVAEDLGLPKPSTEDLTDPTLSIRLGTAYLRTLLDRFDGHHVLATAAYNAGPNRVKQWLPTQGKRDATVWIDHIPFNETRGYVRRVLEYTIVFDHRLDGRLGGRLAERTPAIPAESQRAQHTPP